MHFHGDFAYIDGPFSGHCALAIFSRIEDPQQTIVLLKQLPHAGRTVTNAMEALATTVRTRFALDPVHTQFLQHVPTEGYFLVTLHFEQGEDGMLQAAHPQWHPYRPHARRSRTETRPSPQEEGGTLS